MKNHDIDAFGDAYEYLMTMYASNAGKSGGEFFTPADVSELLTRLGTVGKTEINKVYDPCAGSGHILCVLFDMLVQIYEDYGYTAREAAVSIVQNNLWGLDIDDRAAQLAYFAVMMHKAKISMADEIFVINVDGYIGSSTRSEIEYAKANGKTVRYLES